MITIIEVWFEFLLQLNAILFVPTMESALDLIYASVHTAILEMTVQKVTFLINSGRKACNYNQ